MVSNLGLNRKIIFLGFVADNLLPKFYNLADIFVLPSIDKSEAFGVVSLEAMASGVPVVSSDLAGVRSVIGKREAGVLVKPGDVDKLANTLKYLLDNPTECQQMGKIGREKVLKEYTWDKIGYRLDGVINSMK